MELALTIPVVSLGDCRLPMQEGADSHAIPCAATLNTAFTAWAQDFRPRYPSDAVGVFLIHANSIFTHSGRRQHLQGVELLKHIRLTPWLERARTWHVVIYSFEPLEQILRRTPGNLILLSAGTTFLQLPEAIELNTALARAIPLNAPAWRGRSAAEMLADLAHQSPASPTSRDFRPFVAADYVPPDSAHDISNRWGIYEIIRACADLDRGDASLMSFPEVDAPDIVPTGVLDFARSLAGKKARYLEGGDEVDNDRPVRGSAVSSQTLEASLHTLHSIAAGRMVAYIDDEAHLGWRDVLNQLLSLKLRDASPISNLLHKWKAEAAVASDGEPYDEVDRRYCAALAKWVCEEHTDLLILDLRLLGSLEQWRPPRAASGMKLANAIRQAAPYLPILLFTASNKAETIFASQSLAIDDLWMKPGLGEHRAVRRGAGSLESLVEKLRRLMSSEYAWLARAGGAIEGLNRAQRGAHWWEHQIKWPSPVTIGRSPSASIPDTYTVAGARSGQLRSQILELARTSLDLSRASMRISIDREDVPGQLEMDTLAAAIRAAAFNRIGQIVELIHREEPLKGTEYEPREGSVNGRVGGGLRKDGSYVHRRNDWIAFRLFSFRNSGAHIDGASTSDRDLRGAVCDALAWLTVPRQELRPITTKTGEALTQLVKKKEIVRLHSNDQVSGYSLNCTQDKAQKDSFRTQLAARDAFGPVLAKGDELAGADE